MNIASRIAGVIGLLFAVGACAAPDDSVDESGAEINQATPGPRLLGLGDSIAYGWEPDWSQFQPGQPTNPANLQKAVIGRGYPEKAAKLLGLRADNGSCPGEASASFVDMNGLD